MSSGWGNWGGEDDDWWNESWQNGNGMNVMMMLERRNDSSAQKEGKKDIFVENAKTTGEHDKLTNTQPVKPITLQNKYSALQSEADEDDDADETDADDSNADEHTHNENLCTLQITRHKPNKRQRLTRKRIGMITQADDDTVNQQCPIGFRNGDHIDTTTTTTRLQTRPQRQLNQCNCMIPPRRRSKRCEEHDSDESIRDAAAASGEHESDWI